MGGGSKERGEDNPAIMSPSTVWLFSELLLLSLSPPFFFFPKGSHFISLCTPSLLVKISRHDGNW